eukprot:3952323-Pleurochrysis_carterae.AAC.1
MDGTRQCVTFATRTALKLSGVAVETKPYARKARSAPAGAGNASENTSLRASGTHPGFVCCAVARLSMGLPIGAYGTLLAASATAEASFSSSITCRSGCGLGCLKALITCMSLETAQLQRLMLKKLNYCL